MSHPLPRVRELAARHAQRVVRFGIVGLSGAVVQMSLLYALVEYGKIQHLVAAALASEVSILSNFTLNDRWTFGDARSQERRSVRALRYNLIALSGMVVSLAVLALLADVFGMYYLAANVFAMAAATLSNYVLNLRFTWASANGMERKDPLAA